MAGKWFDPSGRAWTTFVGLALVVMANSTVRLRAQETPIELDLTLEGEEAETEETTIDLESSLDQDVDEPDTSDAAGTSDERPLLILESTPDERETTIAAPTPAAPTPDASSPEAQTPGQKLESDFKDFLQLAVMGRFDEADAFAQSLLAHPSLSPELTAEGANQLVTLTNKYNKSLEMLNILVNKAGIGDNAASVMRLIDESFRRQRMNPQRILANIELLNGSPMERKVALDRLIDSGEYAVPWMLETIENADKKELHPFVIRALPLLGNRAVNPLIVGLRHEDANIRAVAATVLGKIGYPRALPWLQKHASDLEENIAVRNAAAEAIHLIVVNDPASREMSADALFADLAEQYYADADSLRPDPREDRANVWFMRQGVLMPIEVPRDIYRFVMCMRCSEASLELAPSRTEMAALWLAANLKREAAIGLDVESADPVENGLDLTRPGNFPRSLYFARALGARVGQFTLHRAVNDLDREVALGVIAGLQDNAGPAALVEPADPRGLSLAAALDFPDLYVRIRAALALGRALPPMMFRGAEDVVPVLASALNLKGDRFYLVVEPDDGSRRVLVDGLSSAGAGVIAAKHLTQALDDAHRELMHLDGIFLSSDMDTPSVHDAIRQLNQDTRFSLAPVVVLIKRGDALMAEQVRAMDARVGFVLDSSETDTMDAAIVGHLLEETADIADAYQHEPFTPERGLELALASARTLRLIAESNATPFDTRPAQQDLIRALTYNAEELQIAAAAALALIDSPEAQQAIATFALDPGQTESLRIAMFGSLAESARRFGSELRDDQVKELTAQGMNDPNLTLRTAASKALGAMNFPTEVSADVILAQPEP